MYLTQRDLCLSTYSSSAVIPTFFLTSLTTHNSQLTTHKHHLIHTGTPSSSSSTISLINTSSLRKRTSRVEETGDRKKNKEIKRETWQPKYIKSQHHHHHGAVPTATDRRHSCTGGGRGSDVTVDREFHARDAGSPGARQGPLRLGLRRRRLARAARRQRQRQQHWRGWYLRAGTCRASTRWHVSIYSIIIYLSLSESLSPSLSHGRPKKNGRSEKMNALHGHACINV